jgi:hypothetical protein
MWGTKQSMKAGKFQGRRKRWGEAAGSGYRPPQYFAEKYNNLFKGYFQSKQKEIAPAARDI